MEIHGTVHPAFEPVRDVFAETVADSRAGAAFSVVRRGEVVVDLWGGEADPRTGEPWREDTLCVLFSGTKGITAAIVAALADVLDPDERISTYWPQFQADMRVHHVLSHTAGLPYVDGDHDPVDNAAAAAILASQQPLWTPGTRVAYHAMTYGFLLTELVRRVTGRSVGALVRERIAEPYGLDIHLGTPADLDARVAWLVRAPDYRVSTFLHDEERRAVVDRMYRVLLDRDLVNEARYRRAELAAGSGVGSARSMARFYDLLRSGEIVAAPVLRRATRTWSRGIDAVNDRPVHFGLGFELPDPIGTYGPATVAFGHSGAGGGRNGAWPEAELGFSFLTNELRAENADGRADRLLAALHDTLG